MTTAPSIVTRPVTRLLVVLALVLGLSGGVATTLAPPAQAATGVSTTTRLRALHYAASKHGAHYQWGAVGPYRFDCSGLTMWSYAKAGKRIPRTTDQQYRATIHIRKIWARPGDLVFFFSGRRVSHVGIYAGAGRIWHSPRTGSVVKLSTIWTSAVRYGRVIR
jgi:cell wall-associated NlpC family hydrolase